MIEYVMALMLMRTYENIETLNSNLVVLSEYTPF